MVSSIWLSDCLLRLDRLDFLPVMSGILVYLESVPLTFPIDISYLIHSVGIKWNVGGCKLEKKNKSEKQIMIFINHIKYYHGHNYTVFLYPRSTGGGGILFYLCPSFRPSKIFYVAFFSATIDGRNLIFGHKLHIGMPYCGKCFWTRQIPTSCLPT